MSPDAFIGAGIALAGKIIFDWLKGRNGNGKKHASGDLEPTEWDRRIKGLVIEGTKEVVNERFRQRDLEILNMFRTLRHEERDELITCLRIVLSERRQR